MNKENGSVKLSWYENPKTMLAIRLTHTVVSFVIESKIVRTRNRTRNLQFAADHVREMKL